MVRKGLQVWVDKLSKVEMPVLANVVKELNEMTGNDEADVNELADVILKDANLTSQVLRIANSVAYNPSNFPINTVSRAIVLIGFTGVRAICISVMVIDSLLGKAPRERLMGAMAKAFHAAVQARNLVRHTNEAAREEVFIAALLFHLGDMAFWACGAEAADELEELLQDPAITLREGMEQVTGTSLKAITRGLAESWTLGETLTESLYPPPDPTPKVVAVRLGEEISRLAVDGWDTPEMNLVLSKVAEFTGTAFTEVRGMVMDNAEEAAGIALTYGAAKVCHLIPTKAKAIEGLGKTQNRILKAEPQLQLSILRELSNALTEELDVNTVFKMVLEGMHRGIGLERACVAFIIKNTVQAKYILGEGTDKWREQFSFDVGPHQDSIFTRAIKAREPFWIQPAQLPKYKHLYSPEITRTLGKYPAFISLISLGKRNVAVIYADRWNLGGQLSKEQFESFRHFVSQTQMSLELLSKPKK
jgi:HD-like signal output (HDOD) protein